MPQPHLAVDMDEDDAFVCCSVGKRSHRVACQPAKRRVKEKEELIQPICCKTTCTSTKPYQEEPRPHLQQFVKRKALCHQHP